MERFEPTPEMTAQQLAAENVHDVRWWSPAEVASGRVAFAPRALAALLDDLREHGTPRTAVEISGF